MVVFYKTHYVCLWWHTNERTPARGCVISSAFAKRSYLYKRSYVLEFA